MARPRNLQPGLKFLFRVSDFTFLATHSPPSIRPLYKWANVRKQVALPARVVILVILEQRHLVCIVRFITLLRRRTGPRLRSHLSNPRLLALCLALLIKQWVTLRHPPLFAIPHNPYNVTLMTGRFDGIRPRFLFGLNIP